MHDGEIRLAEVVLADLRRELRRGVRASTISPLTTRSSRCTVRTQAFGSPSVCRTSSGTPPGSSVDSTPAGLMHTRMLLS
jgi:hypothetical protein